MLNVTFWGEWRRGRKLVPSGQLREEGMADPLMRFSPGQPARPTIPLSLQQCSR